VRRGRVLPKARADWIDKDIALLRREDPEGVRHFLAAFGGMGSLNDVKLSRPDDGPVGRWRGARRYRRFRELAEAGWSLARELEAQTTQPPLAEGRRGSY